MDTRYHRIGICNSPRLESNAFTIVVIDIEDKAKAVKTITMERQLIVKHLLLLCLLPFANCCNYVCMLIFISRPCNLVMRNCYYFYTNKVYNIQWCQTHIVLCFCFGFLRLVYPMLPVSLNCPFLIVPSLFFNVYFLW